MGNVPGSTESAAVGGHCVYSTASALIDASPGSLVNPIARGTLNPLLGGGVSDTTSSSHRPTETRGISFLAVSSSN